jgi:hypothetical protein
MKEDARVRRVNMNEDERGGERKEKRRRRI